MGIVTKNAIMLVDFAINEIARGTPRNDAIVDAGRKRARPIVMTTIAMCGGMLPSALALDSGGEFRAPMAIAVIGRPDLLDRFSPWSSFRPSSPSWTTSPTGLWRVFGRYVTPSKEPALDNGRSRRHHAGLIPQLITHQLKKLRCLTTCSCHIPLLALPKPPTGQPHNDTREGTKNVWTPKASWK